MFRFNVAENECADENFIGAKLKLRQMLNGVVKENLLTKENWREIFLTIDKEFEKKKSQIGFLFSLNIPVDEGKNVAISLWRTGGRQ